MPKAALRVGRRLNYLIIFYQFSDGGRCSVAPVHIGVTLWGYRKLLMYTDKGRQKTPIYPPQWLNVVNNIHFVLNLLELCVLRESYG